MIADHIQYLPMWTFMCVGQYWWTLRTNKNLRACHHVKKFLRTWFNQWEYSHAFWSKRRRVINMRFFFSRRIAIAYTIAVPFSADFSWLNKKLFTGNKNKSSPYHSQFLTHPRWAGIFRFCFALCSLRSAGVNLLHAHLLALATSPLLTDTVAKEILGAVIRTLFLFA